MNWQAVSFDWNKIRAFLATAEEGSLSAAARALGQTQPTVGRQVSGLEDELGILLFERLGRGLVLTPSGVELLDHVRAMGDAATRVSLAASGQSQTIDGRVLITAADVMATYVLPPVYKHLRKIAPRLEINIVAANDIQDLQRREADIAIRHVRPEQPELIARLVREEKAYFYAATSYLDQRGRPRTLGELTQHDFVGFGEIEEMIAYLIPMGLELTTEHFRLGSASGVVAWQMVKEGLGIAIMDERIGDNTQGVEKLPIAFAPIVFPVWITTHRELHTSRRIRLVYDVLAEFYSSGKLLNVSN